MIGGVDPFTTSLASLGGFSVFAGVASYGTFRAQSGMWGKVHARGSEQSGRVALTFDDGPTAPFTAGILDVLRAQDVKATFFVIGKNAQRWPELVRRMHDEGHVVANHTYSHGHYGFVRSLAYWMKEIRRTDELIQSITGERPRWFRPPLGFKTFLTMRAAQRSGLEVVAWSRRAFDGLPTTAEKILARLTNVGAGDIVLLHDGVAPNARWHDPSPTVAALGGLIERLRGKKLEIVGLDELLSGAGSGTRADTPGVFTGG
jgi:peptidoglycan/xylan/chitin deacetylase (PgdA/CDA1 family)